jgi:hypothetical protein
MVVCVMARIDCALSLNALRIIALGRVDIHASKTMVAAKWRKARKLRAVLS